MGNFRVSRHAASLKHACHGHSFRTSEYFRVSRHAASLKRGNEEKYDVIHAGFPRVSTRGLIEADAFGLLYRTDDIDFRVSRHAASLKPSGLFIFIGFNGEFPRVSTRGLIEATPRSFFWFCSVTISACLDTRPH